MTNLLAGAGTATRYELSLALYEYLSSQEKPSSSPQRTELPKMLPTECRVVELSLPLPKFDLSGQDLHFLDRTIFLKFQITNLLFPMLTVHVSSSFQWQPHRQRTLSSWNLSSKVNSLPRMAWVA